MKEINNEELKKINGGGFSIGLGFLLGGIVTFLVGVIDGYVRPLKCN